MQVGTSLHVGRVLTVNALVKKVNHPKAPGEQCSEALLVPDFFLKPWPHYFSDLVAIVLSENLVGRVVRDVWNLIDERAIVASKNIFFVLEQAFLTVQNYRPVGVELVLGEREVPEPSKFILQRLANRDDNALLQWLFKLEEWELVTELHAQEVDGKHNHNGFVLLAFHLYLCVFGLLTNIHTNVRFLFLLAVPLLESHLENET